MKGYWWDRDIDFFTAEAIFVAWFVAVGVLFVGTMLWWVAS